MKRIRGIVLFILIILTMSNLVVDHTINVKAETATNESDTKEVVKVGWYEEPGKQFYTDDGSCTGYIYEYFKAMEKYGDFDLEFVSGTRNECLNRLKNGDIDVLAAVQDNEINSDYFATTDTTIGMNNVILYSRDNDVSIIPQDYSTYNEKRIAVVQGNDVVTDFETFMDTKGFDCIFVEYSDYASLIEKKSDDMYDMILTNGSAESEFTDFTEIDRFSASPIYLSVSKSNTKLLREINQAMYAVNRYEPTLITELSAKYFTEAYNREMKLSTEEKAYLKALGTVKFGVVSNNGYMAHEYNLKMEGIQPEYVKALCKKLNLDYEIISYTSYNDLYSALLSGEIDVIGAFPYDYTVANEYDCSITPSYYENNYYLVRKKGNNENSDTMSCAIVDYSKVLESSNVLHRYKYDKLIYFDNYSDCLSAVANGEVDYTLCPAIVTDYYLRGSYANNLERVLTDYTIKQSFGSVSSNRELITIISKALGSMTETEKAVIKNDVVDNEDSALSIGEWIYRYPYQMLAVCMVFVVLLVGMTLILYFNSVTSKKNKKIKEAIEASMRDSMTGLYNHLATKNELSRYLENRKQSQTAWFIMMDIDSFKTINDTFGHHEGDRVIANFATVLKKEFHDQCLVSRMGGDEFSVFVTKEYTEAEFIKLLTRFKSALASPVYQTLENYTITVSIGYARVPIDGEDFQTIYQKADKAMYRAKHKENN